jgi:hypothetical protein
MYLKLIKKTKNKVLEIMKTFSEKDDPPTGHSTGQDLFGTSDPDDSAPLTSYETAMQEFIRAELVRKSAIDQAAYSKLRKLKQQLENYLDYDGELVTDGPLQWWKESENNFKELAAIAKQYLTIQATSASSERMLSKANRLLDDRRARLDPETATMILFFDGTVRVLQRYP